MKCPHMTDDQRICDPNCIICRGTGEISIKAYVEFLELQYQGIYDLMVKYKRKLEDQVTDAGLIRENLKHKDKIHVLETLLNNLVEQIFDVADICHYNPMET